jgi:hypothetical protein
VAVVIPEYFTEDDARSIRAILVHHLGHPRARDDDDRLLSLLDVEPFDALELDLLRYCTRLRCQPRIDAHRDSQGYHVPAHHLISTRK